MISHDRRGRLFDTIVVERLWRSVKYEEGSLQAYETVREAKAGLGRAFRFSNAERLHAALGYRTPREVYRGEARLPLPAQPCSLHLNHPLCLS